MPSIKISCCFHLKLNWGFLQGEQVLVYHAFISVTFISKQCAFNVGLLEVHHNVFVVKKFARKWNRNFIKNCVIFYSVVLSWLTKFNMLNRHLGKHNARNIFCFLFLLIPFEYLMGIMGIKKNPMTVFTSCKALKGWVYGNPDNTQLCLKKQKSIFYVLIFFCIFQRTYLILF